MSLRLMGLAFLSVVFSLNAFGSESCKYSLTSVLNKDWVTKKIQEIKTQETKESKIIKEAIQTNGFDKIALNREVYNEHNVNYTKRVFEGELVDQQSAGVCWIVSRLNVYRSRMINAGLISPEFEFSVNYLFFFHLLESAHTILENNILTLQRNKKDNTAYYLEARGTAEVNEAGFPNFFPYLVEKYGLVPKAAMAETMSSKDSARLLEELKYRLGVAMDEMHSIQAKSMKDGHRLSERMKLLRESKTQSMDSILRVLITHLGEPPTKITFFKETKESQRGNNLVYKTPVVKDITPQDFAKKIVKFDPDDFIFVSAVPGYLPGRYKSKRTSVGIQSAQEKNFDLNFLNLPIERLEELVVRAIDEGVAVEFDADIDKDIFEDILHTGIYKKDGIYGLKPDQEKKALNRATMTYYKVSEVKHAMVITGYDKSDGKDSKVKKFLVQNSWAEMDLDEAVNPGKPNIPGDLHMYRGWFLKYVFGVNIPKSLLSKEELEMLKGKAKNMKDLRF